MRTERPMLRRFLIHSLSHTWLIVDITEIGPPTEIYPKEGKEQTVSSLRFQSWRDVERHFLALGASADTLEEASAWLKKCSVAVLTVM
jgi:hypothetical protein